MYIKVNVIDLVISWVKNMIKGPLGFLEMLLLIGVFKVLLLLTLERRVVYASHKHIQANNCNK